MSCPDLKELVDLLEDRLDGSEFGRLAAHIQGCLGCQGRLELLTDSRVGLAGFLTEKSLHGTNGQGVGGASATDVATIDRGRVRSPEPETQPDLGLGSPTDLGSTRTHHSSGRTSPRPEKSNGGLPVVPGYLIEGELGHGGMGVVYLARQLGLKRPVALKMIRDGSLARPDQRARFLLEAEVVAGLRHPNILQVYDIGEAAGLPFVALELLDGGTLADRIKATPQPPTASAELIVTLARAIDVAHRAGVIHRDLKPANILYTADGTPKVADFGLAKRFNEGESGQTQTDQILGSPSYMAPEQAQGKAREARPTTDVYALGAILYELLTGRPPFKGETAMETVKQVVEVEPVPPSRLRPKLPRDLETICLACLQKSPSRRYQTGADLADDLGRYLAGRPIKARRTSVPERAWKWSRRNPVAATLIGLGLVGAIAGTAGGVWYDAHQRTLLASESGRVAALRIRLSGRLEDAWKAIKAKEWNGANVVLTGLMTTLDREPKLADLRPRASDLLDEVKVGLEGEKDRARIERERDEAVAGLGRFREARDRTLYLDFFDPIYSGGADAGFAAVREAATKALELYGDAGREPGRGWSLAKLPPSLTDRERAEVRDGCYELLLMVAGTSGQIGNDDRTRTQAAEGLKVLEDAARLAPPTRAHLLQRAACLARLGRSDEAGRDREAAAKAEPSDAFGRFLLGQERLANNDLPGALREFESALQIEPDHFWAHALTATVQRRLERPGEARAHLDACLQTRSDLPLLHGLRGDAASEDAALKISQADSAPRARARSLRSEADALAQSAEADYRKALESLTGQKERYALLLNRGVLRFRRGDSDGASADFEAAVRLWPEAYQAYASLSEVHRRRGEIDRAGARLDEAIARAPERPELYRGRALLVKERATMTEAQRAAALADLAQAAEREPKENRTRIARDGAERALLLFGARRYEEARAAAAEALKGDPTLAEAHRVHVASLLELKRHEDLLAACDAALERGASAADLHEMRGLARVALRDFGGAVEDFSLALADGPRSALLLSRRGWAYLFADAPQLALPDFDRAVAYDPKHGDARSGRAFARILLGQEREAISEAEEAVKVAGDQPRVLYQAARTYAVAIDRAEKAARRGLIVDQRPRSARAVALLKLALERSDGDGRKALSREIGRDPVLETLRRRGDLPRAEPGRPPATVGLLSTP